MGYRVGTKTHVFSFLGNCGCPSKRFMGNLEIAVVLDKYTGVDFNVVGWK